MKNLIRILSLLMLMGTVTFVACNKHEIVDERNSSNENLELREFNYGSDKLNLEVFVDDIDIGYWPTLIIWRKRNNCNGWGLCSFHWEAPTNNGNLNFVGRELNIPLVLNKSSNSIEPVTLAFTSDPTSVLTDLSLPVDENTYLDSFDTNHFPFESIFIPEGIIDFDSDIGIYGGYIINIEITK